MGFFGLICSIAPLFALHVIYISAIALIFIFVINIWVFIKQMNYGKLDIYWGTKVWNIDINFVVIKIQIKK